MSYLIRVREPQPSRGYSLEMTAELAGLRRREVLICWRYGLVRPQSISRFGMIGFDEHALHTLRQVARVRDSLGVNLTAARVIVELCRELERLRRELDFWRGR
ncbi:MAG: hypothetical protein NZ483_03640 [Verrucomicrobiae bacterium]|nr:hypothetical protein [Verrucomicrobiae bacterium]MDW8344132.1 chaperone modulator CbpM [Verrucomicrobiae bacterium]